MPRTLFALALIALAGPASAADFANAVCSAPVAEGSTFNAVTFLDGNVRHAQRSGDRLVFVVPSGTAGEPFTAAPSTLNFLKAPTAFRFVETRHHSTALLYGDRLVLDFINERHDGGSAESHFRTFKPFHHVYDPATGKVELTSGAHPKTKEYQFPHHRGLFFGFNRISYGDKQTADIWHGNDGVFSQQDKVLATETGSVFGRQVSAISWHGKDGQTFASEERSVIAYDVLPAGTMIDWSTTLTTKLPRVMLDGDPQHAGFHFRASQQVAKNGKQNTYYLRPDGKGKMGETRNWDAKKRDPRTINLPWNAMSFVVSGKRYTVLRINHPDNPKETRGSERDYGRFGDYFEYTLTPDKPLKLKYRVWVQEGEMTAEQCEAMARGFISPPAVKVVR